MTPLFMVFYNLRPLGPGWQLALVAVLATWALVVNGTFFAAISIRTRSREVMLPLILFPISIPALYSDGSGYHRHPRPATLARVLDKAAGGV